MSVRYGHMPAWLVLVLSLAFFNALDAGGTP